ncbi:MAG: HU family DNA-binding protein [Proteobacteria bacterium]|nr:HU family DNA-binding protein [Pseudomonadota bacterium]MBU0966899.1 HU family DNA-binding protein [Pseudomonadota bacterium]
MNKTELVSAIAESAEITKLAADRALVAFLDAVTNALQKGENVTMVGFGTFSTSERTARAGRNPLTGKEIQIAAKKVVKFKPGKALAESIK